MHLDVGDKLLIWLCQMSHDASECFNDAARWQNDAARWLNDAARWLNDAAECVNDAAKFFFEGSQDTWMHGFLQVWGSTRLLSFAQFLCF